MNVETIFPAASTATKSPVPVPLNGVISTTEAASLQNDAEVVPPRSVLVPEVHGGWFQVPGVKACNTYVVL